METAEHKGAQHKKGNNVKGKKRTKKRRERGNEAVLCDHESRYIKGMNKQNVKKGNV